MESFDFNVDGDGGVEQELGLGGANAEVPAAKPASPLPDNWRDGDWKCSVCGDHNFASRSNCRRCDAPRGGGGGGRGTGARDNSPIPDNWRPGDWKCGYCGDHQFASRTFCRRCDAPKSYRGARKYFDDVAKSGEPVKLYVGNLPCDAMDEELNQFMSQFGDVSDCYIIGPKGSNKGFGFVQYTNPEGTEAALKTRQEFHGRKLKIEKSMPKRDEGPRWDGGGGGGFGGDGGGYGGGYGGGNDWGGASGPRPSQRGRGGEPKLYVGKLPADVTEVELKDYLSTFGDVADSVIMNKTAAGPKYGFCTYANSESTMRCLKANPELRGQRLDIQKARPKASERDMSPGRGRDDYGGYRGGGGSYGPPPWERGGSGRDGWDRNPRDDRGMGRRSYYDSPRGGGGGGGGGGSSSSGGGGGGGGGGGYGAPPWERSGGGRTDWGRDTAMSKRKSYYDSPVRGGGGGGGEWDRGRDRDEWDRARTNPRGGADWDRRGSGGGGYGGSDRSGGYGRGAGGPPPSWERSGGGGYGDAGNRMRGGARERW